MQDYVAWWVIAGVLGVAELTTGTFYLLVLCIAALAASAAAWLGLGLSAQMLVAALVAVAGWSWLRARKKASPEALAELDVGEIVEVSDWQGAQGSTQYRGAHWSVELESAELSDGPAPAGRYRIQALKGNRLIVRPEKP